MLASSAFLASAAATSDLQTAILGEDWMTPDSVISTVLAHWGNDCNAPPPEGSLAKKQEEWDSRVVAKAAKMVVEARGVLDMLQLVQQAFIDAMTQGVAVVQSTHNECIH